MNANIQTLLQSALSLCADTNGGEAAAEYIAKALEAVGPAPAGEYGFRYPIGMDADKVITLICNLWDSNFLSYWGVRCATNTPEGYDQRNAPEDWRTAYCRKYTAPLMGGSVALFDAETVDMDDDDQPCDWKLDGEAIQRGLDTFPKAADGRHYADAVSGNDDAVTADVFVQCCLFGKIVYG